MQVFKIFIPIFLFWIFVPSYTLFCQSPIPLPLEMIEKHGSFVLNSNTVIETSTFNDAAFIDYAIDIIKSKTGHTLQKTNKSQVENHIQLIFDESLAEEEYKVDIMPLKITIKGQKAGLFYGLLTVSQIISSEDGKYQIPCAIIHDEPAFGYRGIMLDASRHFIPVGQIKKIIDKMAYYKLNKLHWHLTDDQGWRLQILQYPKLTEIAAWRDSTIIGRYGDFNPFVYDGMKHGGFYTQVEAREIVEYAGDRMITIIPEIEMPGHATAALVAYPELGSFNKESNGYFKGDITAMDKNGKPLNDTLARAVPGFWGVHHSIYGVKENTFEFLENVLTEVMDIFPGMYIHIGGDEVPKDHWKSSSSAQYVIEREKLANEHELQSFFIKKIEAFLHSNGRKLIGWDEILEGGLAPRATVMSWRGEIGGIEAAKLEHDVIMTPNSHLYFDYYQSADIQNEPFAIGGLLPLEKVYDYHPLPEELDENEKKYIIGVQANLWTEYISNSNKMEFHLFPRLMALAELAWTPKSKKNYKEFAYDRLPNHLEELDRLGIHFRIPEALIEREYQTSDSKSKIKMISSVGNGTIYYTLHGHIPDQTATKYTGSIELPHLSKLNKSLDMKYIIVTPAGRSSRIFSYPLNE